MHDNEKIVKSCVYDVTSCILGSSISVMVFMSTVLWVGDGEGHGKTQEHEYYQEVLAWEEQLY